jgi:hypothetical protein
MFWMEYAPVSEVVAVKTAPVSAPVAVIVAPTIAPPELSNTVPEMAPRSDCAEMSPAELRKRKVNAEITNRKGRKRISPPQ